MLLNKIFKKPITALLLTLLLSATLSTAHAKKERKGPPKGKPPVEAFSACENLAEDEACSFNTPENDIIEGTCKVPRNEEESLVCRPNRGKKGDRPHKNKD